VIDRKNKPKFWQKNVPKPKPESFAKEIMSRWYDICDMLLTFWGSLFQV